MFTARFQDVTGFFDFLNTRTSTDYERFHTVINIGDPPVEYLYPVARAVDGSWAACLDEAIPADDVRWPATGSVPLSNWMT